jgi:hypothetical protein
VLIKSAGGEEMTSATRRYEDWLRLLLMIGTE